MEKSEGFAPAARPVERLLVQMSLRLLEELTRVVQRDSATQPAVEHGQIGAALNPSALLGRHGLLARFQDG